MKNQGFILSKFWYYLISFTWGCLLSIPGCLVTLVLMCFGFKPKQNIYGWYIEIGESWGGFNIGPCSLVCKNPSTHLRQHEFGHSIQNCIFGPLMIPFIIIPSICRYWYREINNVTIPPYDYAWYEGLATLFGERYWKNEVLSNQ